MTNIYDWEGEGGDPRRDEAQIPQAAGGTNWDGRIAVNPQTGERLVYRTNPQGRGRFVALSTETADPQARDRYQEIVNRRNTGQRTLRLAERFLDTNADQNTGGPLDWAQREMGVRLPFSDKDTVPRLQRLQSISNQMIGANWQPGTSTMMNTATEQEMIRQRYPTPNLRGPVNQEIYFDMVEDLAEQDAAVRDMERWLSRNPNLNGWDEHWATQAPRIRAQARREAINRFRERGLRPGPAGDVPQRPAGVPESARWNPQTRRWVME